MKSELFLSSPWLWTCVWQSTIFAALGLVGSYILRRRSSRAHQVLLLSMIAAVLVPAASILVKHCELGIFVAEPVRIQTLAEDRKLLNNHETFEIISAGNFERESPAVEEKATPVTVNTLGASFPLRSVVFYGWIATSAILAGRLLATFLFGIRLLRRATPLNCERIGRAMTRAKAKLGNQKDVKVYSSRGVRSPVIWCWGRQPILLVPSIARPSEMDWTGVLCHELAHTKRRDHISGLFAELVVCVLPWQLLLWFARSRLINLSELACDDWVIAAGQPGTDYAESLLDLTPGGQMALVPAVVSSKKGLADRIRRILKDSCGNPRTGAAWALAVGAITICVALGVAFAQTRPAKPDAEPAASEPNEPADPNEPMVSVNFRDVEFKTIILKLADWTGKTIIPSAEVMKLRMTISAPKKVKQSEAVTVVLAALRMTGCVVEETESIVLIKLPTREDPGEASTQSEEPSTKEMDKDQVVQRFFRLQNYSPVTMSRILEPLLSDAGWQRADEESSTLLIIDTVENLRGIEKIIEQLDTVKHGQLAMANGKKEYETVQIGYAEAGEIVGRIEEALRQMPEMELGKNVLLQPLERAKQIIIFGRQDTREIVKKLIAEIDIPPGLFETRIFKLKYANADKVKKNIEALYGRLTDGVRATSYPDSPRVRAISYPKLRQVIVIASPENMLNINRQIAEWDVPLDKERIKPRIFTLRNTDPVQMARLLTTLFAEEAEETMDMYEVIFGKDAEEKRKTIGPLSGRLKFEDVPGTQKIIVISSLPEAYDIVEKLILELDKQKMAAKDVKQVREWIARLVSEGRLGGPNIGGVGIQIETRILTIDEGFFEDLSLYANSVDSLKSWPEYFAPDSGNLASLILDQRRVDLLLNAAMNHEGAKMLMSPRILVREAEEASVFTGQEIPRVSGYAEPNEPSEKPTPEFEYVKMGTFIRIKAHLTPDKSKVYLDVRSETTQIRGFKERTFMDRYTHMVPQIHTASLGTGNTVPLGKTLLIGQRIRQDAHSKLDKLVLADVSPVERSFPDVTSRPEPTVLLMLLKPTIPHK